MNKRRLLERILTQLEEDHRLALQAAEQAHAAATHEENIPDNKYETLALESSYLAQGQANRAQSLRQAMTLFRSLPAENFPADAPIRLGSFVRLESEQGTRREILLGPAAGGLKINGENHDVMLISPESPLGRGLLGKCAGETFELTTKDGSIEYTILQCC